MAVKFIDDSELEKMAGGAISLNYESNDKYLPFWTCVLLQSDVYSFMISSGTILFMNSLLLAMAAASFLDVGRKAPLPFIS